MSPRERAEALLDGRLSLRQLEGHYALKVDIRMGSALDGQDPVQACIYSYLAGTQHRDIAKDGMVPVDSLVRITRTGIEKVQEACISLARAGKVKITSQGFVGVY